MTDQQLYLLTGDQAEDLNHYVRLDGAKHLRDALDPLDRDTAVEIMARAQYDWSEPVDSVVWDEADEIIKTDYRLAAGHGFDELLRNKSAN